MVGRFRGRKPPVSNACDEEAVGSGNDGADEEHSDASDVEENFADNDCDGKDGDAPGATFSSLLIHLILVFLSNNFIHTIGAAFSYLYVFGGGGVGGYLQKGRRRLLLGWQ